MRNECQLIINRENQFFFVLAQMCYPTTATKWSEEYDLLGRGGVEERRKKANSNILPLKLCFVESKH